MQLWGDRNTNFSIKQVEANPKVTTQWFPSRIKNSSKSPILKTLKSQQELVEQFQFSTAEQSVFKDI